jgi:hypothetical protein
MNFNLCPFLCPFASHHHREMSTKVEFEAELAEIKARADYYERPDLISRRTFLETELNRLNGATQGNFH